MRSASSPSSCSPRPPRRRRRSRPRRVERIEMTTANRPRLLVPGLLPRDPARETYRVRPGEATVVRLEPDDRLTVRDLHGAQRAELSVADADYGALELRPPGPAELFGPTSPAGAEETFRASRAAAGAVAPPPAGPRREGGLP